jgi:hypothetical protein
VLLIVNPETKIPPEQIAEFFSGLSQKNNLCVLTGDKTAMASLTQAARHVFAAGKAKVRIPDGHAQREELDQKAAQYDQAFTSTILSLFDKVLFPMQRRGQQPALVQKALDQTRDTSTSFDGAEQIEKTLLSDPLKLYVEVESNFDALREKAEMLLWPEGQTVVRNEDFVRRYSEQAAMPWLPPRGLDDLKAIAFDRGLWEDLGDGKLTKKPVPKKTSVQAVRVEGPSDDGTSVWDVNAVDAGPDPRVHFAENGLATTKSQRVPRTQLSSNALRLSFLAVDPSGRHETGEPVLVENTPKLRNRMKELDGKRTIELLAAPSGSIRYTIDGSESRNGIEYAGPFEIPDAAVTVLVFCDADGIEVRDTFTFPAKDRGGVTTRPEIDPSKPARLSGGHRFDSRAAVLRNLAKSADLGVQFQGVMLTIGSGTNLMRLMTMGDISQTAAALQLALTALLTATDDTDPWTFTFKEASFPTGDALEQFADECDIKLKVGEVHQ